MAVEYVMKCGTVQDAINEVRDHYSREARRFEGLRTTVYLVSDRQRYETLAGYALEQANFWNDVKIEQE